MISRRFSQRRIGSARSASQGGWSQSFRSSMNSVKNAFLSTSDKQKKNDDYFKESWMPSKPDFVLGDNKKKKDSWLMTGLAIIGCCGFLGSVTGYLRSRALVPANYTGSTTAASLVQLAGEAKFDELHLALQTSIRDRCPDAVSALSKEAMFNFQSHMVDIVQHVSDGMSLTHVSSPAVDKYGGVFDRKHEDTKGYDCVVMDELVQISHTPSHTHEDYDGEFSQSYESYEQTLGHALTGYAEYDSKLLVSLANKGNFYELEMTIHKALEMHCTFTGMSDTAKFGLHSHVAELLEKIATHHASLRGLEFTPAVDIEDGTLVDGSETMNRQRFQTCSLLSHVFTDALAPVERAVETLFETMKKSDFYHAELQADLLVEFHCPNAKAQLSNEVFSQFRQHLSNFVYHLLEEKAIGKHDWAISQQGSIVVEHADTISCPVLNVMTAHHGDQQHDEKDYTQIFNEESAAAKEEETYLKSHSDRDVKHDVEFLRVLVEENDHAGLEKYVPFLLERHCETAVHGEPEYVLRNMRAHVIGTLYWVASGEYTSIADPRFDTNGEIVGGHGSRCSLLTELYACAPAPKKSTRTTRATTTTQPPVKTTSQSRQSASTTSSSSKSSYKAEVLSSQKFIDKPMTEQVTTVLKELSDNDWFDAESHVFDMIEQECDDVFARFVKVHGEDAADKLLLAHSNVMGFIHVVSTTDELPEVTPYIADSGEVKFASRGAQHGGTQCKVLDAFMTHARNHLKDAGHKHIDVQAEMSRQKGHESHVDDVAHDVSLLIEDATSQQVIDMELDVENDLKTHCPDMMNKLRSRSRRKLHAKVIQIAESIATHRHHPIRDAVVTNSGGIVSKNSAGSERTFECSFVAELAARV